MRAVGPRTAPVGGLKPADWCATALRVHRMSASPGRSHDRLVWLWLRHTPLALAGQLAAAVWGSLGQLRAVPSAVTPVPSTDAGSGPLGPGGVGQGSVSTATAIESLADAAYACVRKASATLQCQLHGGSVCGTSVELLPYAVQLACIAFCRCLVATPRGRVTPPLPCSESAC